MRYKNNKNKHNLASDYCISHSHLKLSSLGAEKIILSKANKLHLAIMKKNGTIWPDHIRNEDINDQHRIALILERLLLDGMVM